MNATDQGDEPLGEGPIDTLTAIKRGAVLGMLSAADEVLATKQLAERQGQAINKVREKHRRITIKATSCPEECEVHEDECPEDVDFPVCRECWELAEAVNGYFAEEPHKLRLVEYPCDTIRAIDSAGV